MFERILNEYNEDDVTLYSQLHLQLCKFFKYYQDNYKENKAENEEDSNESDNQTVGNNNELTQQLSELKEDLQNKPAENTNGESSNVEKTNDESFKSFDSDGFIKWSTGIS